MKPVQALLLNVAIVAVALVVYDQLRSEPSSPGRTSASRSNNTAELEARLSALEAKSRVSRDESTASNRVDVPDATEQAHATPGDPAPRKTSDRAKPTKGKRASKPASDDEPSADEVRRFRQVREAVRREESVKRNWKRVSSALKKLSINLTEKQRELVHFKYAAFEPKIRQIWGQVRKQAEKTAKAGGDVNRADIVATTNATIQSELAKTLTDVVDHEADAQAIAEALVPARGQGKR